MPLKSETSNTFPIEIFVERPIALLLQIKNMDHDLWICWRFVSQVAIEGIDRESSRGAMQERQSSKYSIPYRNVQCFGRRGADVLMIWVRIRSTYSGRNTPPIGIDLRNDSIFCRALRGLLSWQRNANPIKNLDSFVKRPTTTARSVNLASYVTSISLQWCRRYTTLEHISCFPPWMSSSPAIIFQQ